MRSLFLLAIAGLFMAGDFVSATTTSETTTRTIPSTIENPTIGRSDLHYVDRDVQSRRKDWDVFGVLLMMINSECGPHGEVHLPDCPTLQTCKSGVSADCTKLCNKSGDHGKSRYSKFCDYDGSGSNSNAANSNSYNDSSNTGGFATGEQYSVEWDYWMITFGVAVGMVLVAVHIGQRREAVPSADDQSLLGSEVRGAVSRRVGVVSDIMNSVLPPRGSSRHPEMPSAMV